jgi:hypothetical protein
MLADIANSDSSKKMMKGSTILRRVSPFGDKRGCALEVQDFSSHGRLIIAQKDFYSGCETIECLAEQ